MFFVLNFFVIGNELVEVNILCRVYTGNIRCKNISKTMMSDSCYRNWVGLFTHIDLD